MRSKAQLSLRKTSNVVWPRYVERGRWVRCWLGELPCVVWARYKERDARFGAGLESSFSSFVETSLVVLTHRCQMLNGGEAAEGA